MCDSVAIIYLSSMLAAPFYQSVEYRYFEGNPNPLVITTTTCLSEGEKRMKAEAKKKREEAKDRKKAAREIVEEYHVEITDDLLCCDKGDGEFVKLKGCGHIFHADCVKKVRKNCPTCHKPFEAKLEYSMEYNMWFEYKV